MTVGSESQTDITNLQSDVTDVLADTTALLVDVAAVQSDVTDTLAETKEIERHIHNYERWIGPAAVASGENHIADPLGEVGGTPAGVVTSFRLTAGANKTWGTAVQIWGATDCAVVLPAGRQDFFDLHRLRATNVETNTDEWFLRTIAGTSAAAGVAADTYSVTPLFIDNTNKSQTPVNIVSKNETAGTKIWAQLLHVSDNNADWADFQFGAHGYPA